MKRILVVEDEEAIREFVVINLKRAGYDTVEAGTGEDAIKLFEANPNGFQIALLDIALPGIDGLRVCKELRKHSSTMGIIMLTARTQEMDKVTGLMLGADDYITKPFRLKELLVRIKSVLRRYNRTGGDATVKIKNITINTNEAKVYKNGEEIVLTAMEYRLLLILLNNRGKVLSRSQLLENIWDVEGDFVEDNTLTVYIKRLRDKIEEDAASSQIIKTVRGLGYMIDNE